MAKKIEMHVPNKQYDGIFGGVRFHKGIGVFEDLTEAKRLAEQFGFEIKDIEEAEAVAEEVKAEEVVEEAPVKPKRKPRKKAEKAGE
ncbi:hypothetical protein ABEX38_29895 [Priestia megaterium]